MLAEPLANELTRGQALRFGALLHDIAKPQTRDVTAEGRVTFMGHDARRGAAGGARSSRRLRASERLSEHVAALTRHHLRLGFLVHEVPLAAARLPLPRRRASRSRSTSRCCSVADRLATRGRGAERGDRARTSSSRAS